LQATTHRVHVICLSIVVSHLNHCVLLAFGHKVVTVIPIVAGLGFELEARQKHGQSTVNDTTTAVVNLPSF